MFLPQSEKLSFAPIQYNRQNHSFYPLIFSFFIYDGRQKILYRMVASIP
jgi:hypothetical protein